MGRTGVGSGLKVPQSITTNIVRQDKGDGGLVDPGCERTQPVERVVIVIGQRGVQAPGHAAEPLHQRQIIQSGQGTCEELLWVKLWIDVLHRRRHAPETLRVEPFLQCGGSCFVVRGGHEWYPIGARMNSFHAYWGNAF